MNSSSTAARLYLRRNGSFGASCGTIRDTGHHIAEDSGLFTVWSIHDEEQEICSSVPRKAAESAIAKDWHASGAKVGAA